MNKPTERRLCDAPTRWREGTCAKPAGWGTDHVGYGNCRLHAGKLNGQAQAAQKAMASKAASIWGVPRHIDPADGLMEEYWRSAGIVLGLEKIVREIKQEDLTEGVVEIRQRTGGEANGGAPNTETIRKVAPNIWLRLWNDERDRWAKLGIEIVRLGLEARRDEYIRAQVEVFAQVLLAPELALTAEQRVTAARLLRGLGARPDQIDGEVLNA